MFSDDEKSIIDSYLDIVDVFGSDSSEAREFRDGHQDDQELVSFLALEDRMQQRRGHALRLRRIATNFWTVVLILLTCLFAILIVR